MSVYKDLPQVKMTIHNSHEEWNGIENPRTKTPAVHKLELGEHTGTHVDAINHMEIQHQGKSIDKMPLSMFYTEGICLDFSHKRLKELIEPDEIVVACAKADFVIKQGHTVLFYTDHYRSISIVKTVAKARAYLSLRPNGSWRDKFLHLVLKLCRQVFQEYLTREFIMYVEH